MILNEIEIHSAETLKHLLIITIYCFLSQRKKTMYMASVLAFKDSQTTRANKRGTQLVELHRRKQFVQQRFKRYKCSEE